MALSDTLSVADFADQFRVQECMLVQSFMQQSSMTGGGERRYADRAPSMWEATVTTEPMVVSESESLMALINSRAGGIKTVLSYNYRMSYPPSDPDGSILGAMIPKLGTITDRLHVAFTGFPAGYVVPRGTYFGIVYDTSRYYLGQFAESKTASVGGNITATEVWPPLPQLISGTPDVLFKKPPAKFKITPGSAYPSKEDGVLSTIQFSLEQTYSR